MKKFLLGFVVGLIAFVGIVSDVKAEMLITPTQIVFEGRDRFANVTLVNIGDKTHAYEVSFIYMKMSEPSGTYIKMDSAFTNFDLAKHIVFSPKRVVLKSGARQKVRLALRRPAEIPDGDHRLHLSFKVVSQDENLDSAPLPEGRSSASVSFNINYSIPVVLRSGDVVVNAVIDDMGLSRNKDTGLLNANISILRAGDTPYSILGYLRVYHINASGDEVLVGEISNANIFSEVSRRVFNVPFTKVVAEGSLRVVLGHYDSNKNIVYAERAFPIE